MGVGSVLAPIFNGGDAAVIQAPDVRPGCLPGITEVSVAGLTGGAAA